jgi:hypothetical protein
MGKRAPADEKPFNPVEAALVRSVMAPEPPPEAPAVVVRPPAVPQDLPVKDPPETDGATRPKLLRSLQLRTPTPQPDKLNREKRVLLTQAEEREVERVVASIAEELSTPVKLSHLLRACVTLLRHAEEQIVDQARQTGSLTRPSNGDPAALAEFEFRLAQILSAAFRDAARLR